MGHKDPEGTRDVRGQAWIASLYAAALVLLTLAYFLLGASRESTAMEGQMTEIEIRLGSMLHKDTVVVSANGQEVARFEDQTIGPEVEFGKLVGTVTVPTGSVAFSVEIPTKSKKSESYPIDTAKVKVIHIDTEWNGENLEKIKVYPQP